VRIVVFEHYSASPAGAVPPALRRAGGAMARALTADLGAIPGLSVVRVPVSRHAARRFHEALRRADAAVIIAPEQDGILERRLSAVLRARARLLGPGPRSAGIAGDKLATARLLERAGIATPWCEAIPLRQARRRLAARSFPFVVKPRDGCGAEAVTIVRRARDLGPALRRLRAVTRRPDLLVQEWVPGTPASVSLVVRAEARDGTGRDGPGSGLPGRRTGAEPRGIVALAVGRQRLPGRSVLSYEGGEIPWRHPRAAEAVGLARRAVAALAREAGDVRGFVGVDVVVGDEGAQVIEINPRLTSSYLGLRRVLSPGPAQLLLDAALGRAPARLPRARGKVVFDAGGRTRVRR
jgi:predicted ATP-grasp superfamily ATP-dependent carboligase